jgi:hypothetical protein
MYAWLWRKLPFGLYGKLTGSLALTLATGALLWYVVFPWAEPLLPFDDVQVETSTGDQGPAQQDPGAGEDDPGLGPGAEEDGHELPYDTDTNNPEPSATATR